METEEHRETARHQTLRGAQIVFNHRSSTISRHLVDLIDKGARIDVPTTLGIPAEFELYIEMTKEWHNCAIAWRSCSRLGVEFF